MFWLLLIAFILFMTIMIGVMITAGVAEAEGRPFRFDGISANALRELAKSIEVVRRRTGFDGEGGRCLLDATIVSEGGKTVTRCSLQATAGQRFAFASVGKFFAKPGPVGKEVESGDPGFDSLVQVQGNPSRVAAFLDVATRRAIVDAVSEGAEIDASRVTIDRPGRVTDPAGLAESFRTLIPLTRAASVTPKMVPRRLLQNALEDPEVGVGLRCLTALQDTYPTSEETRLACEALSGSEHQPKVRLQAARGIGASGLPIIREVAFDNTVGPAVRLAAVRELAAWAQKDRSAAIAVLGELAEVASGPTLDAVLGTLADYGSPPPLPTLKRAAQDADTVVRKQAARCLAYVTPGADAEDVLLGLLDPEHTDVAVAAAEALGLVGSARAVEPLLELSEGLLRPPPLKAAARAAVDQIQQRLVDVSGGLALADAEVATGGLALTAPEPTLESATAEVGALSPGQSRRDR